MIFAIYLSPFPSHSPSLYIIASLTFYIILKQFLQHVSGNAILPAHLSKIIEASCLAVMLLHGPKMCTGRKGCSRIIYKDGNASAQVPIALLFQYLSSPVRWLNNLHNLWRTWTPRRPICYPIQKPIQLLNIEIRAFSPCQCFEFIRTFMHVLLLLHVFAHAIFSIVKASIALRWKFERIGCCNTHNSTWLF